MTRAALMPGGKLTAGHEDGYIAQLAPTVILTLLIALIRDPRKARPPYIHLALHCGRYGLQGYLDSGFICRVCCTGRFLGVVGGIISRYGFRITLLFLVLVLILILILLFVVLATLLLDFLRLFAFPRFQSLHCLLVLFTLIVL